MFDLWVVEKFSFLKSFMYFTLQEVNQNAGTQKAHILHQPESDNSASIKMTVTSWCFKVL
jgi:hypothetical protein